MYIYLNVIFTSLNWIGLKLVPFSNNSISGEFERYRETRSVYAGQRELQLVKYYRLLVRSDLYVATAKIAGISSNKILFL